MSETQEKPMTFRQKRAPKRTGSWTYDPKVADEVLHLLYDGLSLAEACRQLKVDEKMIYHWSIRDLSGFSKRYLDAKLARALRWAEEIMDIADDSTNDYVERKKKNGETFLALDTEAVLRSRLRIDTRKWMLSRMLPKLFGEKVINEHEGQVEIHVKQIVLPPEVEAPKMLESTPASE